MKAVVISTDRSQCAEISFVAVGCIIKLVPDGWVVRLLLPK